jgi:hypothetical protein
MITQIRRVTYTLVETDKYNPIYRRYTSTVWENLVRNQWEQVGDCDSLEAEYQAYIEKNTWHG